MTREMHRQSSDTQDSTDAEVLAGLWEQAAFPRLPRDAPSVLEGLVEDVDNPRRVYTVHRASRRHNFQLLVQKFVVQLRDGCGSSTCTTPTCFSCRKRIVGRAPIRRYNTTSARTLAVYLASQDNPEAALCPTLRPPKAPPAALNSLVFSGKVPTSHVRASPSKNPPSAVTPNPIEATTKTPRRHSSAREKCPRDGTTGDPPHNGGQLTITEKPSSKDYRSFAANLFGTVAFKMLEWLTPAGLEELARKASEHDGRQRDMGSNVSAPESRLAPRSLSPERVGGAADDGSQSPKRSSHDDAAAAAALPVASVSAADSFTSYASSSASGHNSTSPSSQAADEKPSAEQRLFEANGEITMTEKPATYGNSAPPPRPGQHHRNSNTRIRTASNKPKRNLSIDALPSDQSGSDDFFSAVKSPRLNSITQDKGSRPSFKPASSTIPRPISQLSNAGIFDGVPLETMPAAKTSASEGRPRGGQGGYSHADDRRPDATDRAARSPGTPSSSENYGRALSPCDVNEDLEPSYCRFMPQSLSRLNPEIVDMFCDILQDDSTAESHLYEPPYVWRHDAVREGVFHKGSPLQRKQPGPGPYPSDLLLRWMMFIEQSFFYVLSDPRRLLRSFTKKGQLYDSQTLWYCLLRMSRVAPTVVIHSLWMASEALFASPDPARSSRSPTAKPSTHETPLSDTEAGMLLSISLHLLIAVAPLVLSKEELQDMSRIRSHGLILARTGGGASRPSTKLCLAYNDAFSNDLAIRLARRLFAAIMARGRTANHVGGGGGGGGGDNNGTLPEDVPRILEPLFQQLDFSNGDTMYMLHFSIPSRAVHEIRAPTLLLDWARNIMLHEWDGRAEVPGDGPFGGALALIKAMYSKRRLLVLADGQFRADYFAERLDEVEMPVSWLSFHSAGRKCHLLDYPFMFSQTKLVTYFRSINFARMSKSFEESNSLNDMISAIVPPRGSLISNPHYKNVLHDMLKAASSKYLVLSISRDRVLEDTFDQLWRREERELIRPLKVRLGEGGGEEGFDSGGVQQEFFRMAMAEALNPDYGLFKVDERTKMTWFNPGSPEPDWKFELLGLLFSLAVFNGLTLPVTFPEALYCKLLGEPVTELHHIADGWPELASGLTTLLDWDESAGSVEDVFSLTYEFSVSMFGQVVSREMKSEGDSAAAAAAQWPCFPSKHSFGGTALSSSWSSGTAPAPPLHEGNPTDAPAVTRENRNAYVADYIRYLTDVSVRPQFDAFARGFRTCLGAKPLALLTPRLLRSVVEGVQDIDVGELRRHARYVGWDASHRTVRDFWSVVRRFDPAMRRKLLEFVTASDRVPVGGLKNLQFVIQRNGEEDEGGHLPTAYTCYGILLLPQYRDKDVLRERLCMALENAQGFGFA